MSRHVFNGLLGAVVALAFLIFFRFIWAPDPAQSLFARAGRLEAAGATVAALEHYRLISDKHPESFYAPRALLRQGDLLAAWGRRDNNTEALKESVVAYERLATTYPADPLATEALLDAGRVAAENLGDRSAAKGFYGMLLERTSSKSDVAATATLKLGRLAIDDHDGKTAQTLLQRVLQRWPQLSDRASEAQYFLGVAYETLFKNKEWATRAYDATIERYPSSIWANDARGRLGLIVFSDTKGHRPARRVLIDVAPLPDDGSANGSLWASLRPILAARGVEADDVTLRGWSLAPFYAGFDTTNPSRVVTPQFDAFENVVANAGLRYTIKSGGKEAEALQDLQDEVDAAHAPLVYFEDKGQGTWALCVGYDSDRGEVMLQSRGARFDTLNAKAFAAMWKAKSSLGNSYTMISLVERGARERPKPSLTPTPAPTALPGQTPSPQLLTAPAFVWELPQIKRGDAERRTLQRAAALLVRPRSGNVALNAEGLNLLAVELRRVAQTAPTAEAVEPTPLPEATTVPAEGEAGGPEAESPYLPTVTPTAPPLRDNSARSNRNDTARARALLGFLGDPAREWANRRREGALWCDQVANRLNEPRLKQAASSLRASASALEEAILLAPSSLSDPLGAGDRTQLIEVARQIERARDAERAAARAMQ